MPEISFDFPFMAFLWRSRKISRPVVRAARRGGVRAVFDIASASLEEAFASLVQAEAREDCCDLKVSPLQLQSAGFRDFLRRTGIARFWVELHPALLDASPARLLDRMARLSAELACFPVLADPHWIERVLREYPELQNLAIKGSEASGFVSTESTFVLHAAVVKRMRELRSPRSLCVWGGVGTPEAAAALLSTGSAGIVFESLHWLTDLASPEAKLRDRLLRLRPEHTTVIGSKLKTPCRILDKGNSETARGFRALEESLCRDGASEEDRSGLARRIVQESVHALESTLDRSELVALGVEAAFARSFVERFGTEARQAFHDFKCSVKALTDQAKEKKRALVESPVAREMGLRYPFIQGAMSWITDVPAFAVSVARAGALPTVALGLMGIREIEARLGGLREAMGDLPYAVNVIALPENPFLDDQLAWMLETKPPFAVVAAGPPSFAKPFLQAGIEVVYIAPNEDSIRMAFKEGVRYVVCEGNEAGGHVGEHSTLTFAQIVLDLKAREPRLFQGRRIVLAGGICNRQTAFMATLLGADALQMGTVYLSTREIVSAGALTDLYRRMILRAETGSTVVTGEKTGLRIRSLISPKTEALASLENRSPRGGEEERRLREELELLASGSLFTAARGLDGPGGRELDEEACLQEGQFMSGACAGLIDRASTLEELHASLAGGPSGPPTFPASAPALEKRKKPVPESGRKATTGGTKKHELQTRGRERIAVTGMSVFNALGDTPREMWERCIAGESGIDRVPPHRWDHSRIFDPVPLTPEKTYCDAAAFSSLEVSRQELGIPPQDFRTMTPATRATLWLAQQAIEDSNILESDIPRERIAVLVSQNSGEAAPTLQDMVLRLSAEGIVDSMKKKTALSPETEEALREALRTDRVAVDDTTLLGRLNCIPGGLLCSRYGFMGPSYAVSAACATFLVALYSAYQMIRNGIVDAAVVGGAEELLTPLHFLEFSALGALAGLSGVERPAEETSRPFDAHRDGMVLGEGGGVIVVERESVARRRGVRIHGCIVSMGACNNPLGLVESSRRAQRIAMEASFRDASYGPGEVDMVECHATGTKQGDLEEVLALRSVLPSHKRTVLTSFKSQIGHTLGASGINSLVRGLMAAKSGIYPPSLNCRHPDPAMGLPETGFRILGEAEEWKSTGSRPRRFQVNAFGFGGSNYVAQLEEGERDGGGLQVPCETWPRRTVEEKGARTPEGVHLFHFDTGGRSFRLGVVSDTREEAETLVREARLDQLGDSLSPGRLKALARQGIYAGTSQAPLPVAFVFPGQGAHYAGMALELYRGLPAFREELDRMARWVDFDLLDMLFHRPEEELRKTRWQQPALFAVEYALARYLLALGIAPAAAAGHSVGELTALCVAGAFSCEDGLRMASSRALYMEEAASIEDPGIMMATDAPLSFLEECLRGNAGATVTNINSPRQTVFGGDTRETEILGEKLREEGYHVTPLQVSAAFHCPKMEGARRGLQEALDAVPFGKPRIPVASNATGKLFPRDPEEIKRLLLEGVDSPVRWMQSVRTLWQDCNVKVFVEAGPREVLGGFILDSLPEARTIPVCLPSSESLSLRTALARLYALGHLRESTTPEAMGLKPASPSPSPPAAVPPRPVGPPEGAEERASSRMKDLSNPLESIVQREIHAFVLESFGRFLKPKILEAIRNERDARFTEENLDDLLSRMFPPSSEGLKPPGEDEKEQPDIEEIAQAILEIIMDATGYERDEIAAEMNLREDLSIRSSRIPVIAGSIEERFGIRLSPENFMDVRTVNDIARKISSIIEAKNGERLSEDRSLNRKEPPSIRQGESATAEEPKNVHRLIFRDAPLRCEGLRPVELDPLESVAILSIRGRRELSREVAATLRRDYGIAPLVYPCARGAQPEDDVRDPQSPEGASPAEERLRRTDSLAGMVFAIDDRFQDDTDDPQEAARILKETFSLLKVLLASPSRKFAVVAHSCRESRGFGAMLAEGIHGMFVSLVHEFPSVLFRHVRLDATAETSVALRSALNRNIESMEIELRGSHAFTREGFVSPIDFTDIPRARFGPGDVVVFSGGGHGITSALAYPLIALGCKTVFLGRTAPGGEGLLDGCSAAGIHGKGEKAVRENRSREIERSMKRLQEAGANVDYCSCDVTDRKRVEETMTEIARREGGIDGIVHGAGLLKDRFFRQMTPDDFSDVLDVKLQGAWNLFKAAEPHGLRRFIALSSVAAVLGSPGQVNYSCANRALSSLMEHLRARNESVGFKALMLPPVEGSGMAGRPEIRSMMKRMNMGYIEKEELAELFAKEALLGSQEEVRVMFAKTLPSLSTVAIHTGKVEPPSNKLSAASVRFAKNEFPMIDEIRSVNPARRELVARRTFSLVKDLWLEDHKPFKFLESPIVSAVMAVEALMEASRVLYPYLTIKGFNDLILHDLIECPPGRERSAEIFCKGVRPYGKEAICEAKLSSPGPSRSGRFSPGNLLKCEARIVLSRRDVSTEVLEGFPVEPSELDGGPVSAREIARWYEERTDMGPRYRIVGDVPATGRRALAGRFRYGEAKDFSCHEGNAYQYSPYLLEAMMQEACLFAFIRSPLEKRLPIPYRIGEMAFSRKCSEGEAIALEARLVREDEKGMTWSARAVDEEGKILMYAKNMEMRWLTP